MSLTTRRILLCFRLPGRPVLNPLSVTHHAGGSSGGAGAAVAARAAPVALCADSGGGCRFPAAATGAVGFRPSTGCFNAGAGFLSRSGLRDTVGVIARSAGDVQLLASVLSDCLEHPDHPPLPNVHAAPLTGLGIHAADIHGPSTGAPLRRRALRRGRSAAEDAEEAAGPFRPEAASLRGLRVGVPTNLWKEVGGALGF